MAEKTGLESQEEEVRKVLFGNPGSIGGVDKSMLEMTSTNKLVFDSRQSELHLAARLLHQALVLTENRQAAYKKVKDPQTGQWSTRREYTDSWRWLKDFIPWVMENQLTIKGYSRSQHLRQASVQMGVANENEPQPGFFERILR